MTLTEAKTKASHNAHLVASGSPLPISSGDLSAYAPLYFLPAGCGHEISTYRWGWRPELCIACRAAERNKYKKRIWKSYYGERYRERRNLLKRQNTAKRRVLKEYRDKVIQSD